MPKIVQASYELMHFAAEIEIADEQVPVISFSPKFRKSGESESVPAPRFHMSLPMAKQMLQALQQLIPEAEKTALKAIPKH